MSNPAEPYIEAAFRAYFPTAIEFDISFHGDESIAVEVLHAYPDMELWECEIGSDDDRYVFTQGLYPFGERRIITVPLMQESAS